MSTFLSGIFRNFGDFFYKAVKFFLKLCLFSFKLTLSVGR